MLLYEQKSCITFQINGASIGTLECLAVPKFTTSLDTGPQSFFATYCPVDDTLFEVMPEIGCSDVSSR